MDGNHLPTKENNVILQCRDLCKRYTVDGKRVDAAKNIDLDIRQGEFITILGHSGSGKTTLLSLLGGLTTPDSGKVLLRGKNPWAGKDHDQSAIRNKHIGFVFQFASLIPTLTVLENILLPMSFTTDTVTAEQRATSLLDQVGLAEKANAFPGQLSGGQQRRVAIARAFINAPEIILADEPTGDLDEATEADILAFFRDKNRQGTTFVVVTHNRAMIASQDHPRVASMKDGVLHEESIK